MGWSQDNVLNSFCFVLLFFVFFFFCFFFCLFLYLFFYGKQHYRRIIERVDLVQRILNKLKVLDNDFLLREIIFTCIPNHLYSRQLTTSINLLCYCTAYVTFHVLCYGVWSV